MTTSPHWQPTTHAEKVARIRSLADQHEPADIAAMLNIPPSDVREALSGFPRTKWWVLNHKTGKSFHAMSKRGAYLRVCLLGWVDWSWGMGDTVGQGAQP